MDMVMERSFNWSKYLTKRGIGIDLSHLMSVILFHDVKLERSIADLHFGQKACDTFEKLSSLKPANEWLAVYAPRIRKRLQVHLPKLVDELTDQDILAMQMVCPANFPYTTCFEAHSFKLCGYETIAQGHSPFCHVFSDEEWLDFEYQQDIRFYYMLGYGQPLSPYLGMPWVKTALHLLDGKETQDEKDGDTSAFGVPSYSEDLKPLPKPRLPPNATHTQR